MCDQRTGFQQYFWILYAYYQRRNKTSFVKQAYKSCKSLVTKERNRPHTLCDINCEKLLCDWMKGRCKGLPNETTMTCRNWKTTQLTVLFVKSMQKTLARKLSPTGDQSIDEIPETDYVTQEIRTDSNDHASTPQL